MQALVDSECIFIGHGLGNDFRVFNISIEAKLVRDTVLLFHLSGNRSLSLKFLTWHFFNEVIQTEEHDSVIDARTVWERGSFDNFILCRLRDYIRSIQNFTPKEKTLLPRRLMNFILPVHYWSGNHQNHKVRLFQLFYEW